MLPHPAAEPPGAGARRRGLLDRAGREHGRGERPAGRAELLAKEGKIWAHAASAGTGTDPWMLREVSVK